MASPFFGSIHVLQRLELQHWNVGYRDGLQSRRNLAHSLLESAKERWKRVAAVEGAKRLRKAGRSARQDGGGLGLPGRVNKLRGIKKCLQEPWGQFRHIARGNEVPFGP